jgi:spore maturation protein CgeB
MKILLVGSSKPWSIERYFVKYLRQLGAEVVLYGSGDIVFDFHTKNLVNKVLFHSKLKTMYPEVNRGLLIEARRISPDVIWVFKGMEIYPETLRQLGREGFMLANFNPDHPFIFVGRGSGNKNVTDSVGCYDLHFCYQRQLQHDIKSRYNIETCFLPFAYEKDDVIYADPSDIKEVNKVCFQANPDPYRVEMISLFSCAGIAVDVFGHGWQKTRIGKMKGVTAHPLANRSDFWQMNQSYRVQLNLFRKHNFGSHNMRTFEIPVVGGIQLTPFSEEQAEFFKEGEEVFFFRSNEDLIDTARNLMARSESEIAEVRFQARKKSLETPCAFSDRAATVYEAFKAMR